MLTAIDFYKADHRSQYPDGTQIVYSNYTPRSTKYAQTDYIVIVGIQGFIKKHLIKGFKENFFDKPKEEALRRYKRRLDNSLGPDAVNINHIGALHDLGYLPLRIKALPEGSRVPARVPVLTIVNTKPEFFWLVNYLESFMSAELWMPMTSASIADKYKQTFVKYAKLTGTPVEFCDLQGHDFSFRGMPGLEAAKLSGFGHLTSFIGTDTVPAIDYAEDYYGADSDNEFVGVSVPATEHSVMCMSTKEDEVETFRRLIEDLYPVGIVSIVSDTWDLWKVLTEYSVQLKDKIEARKDITDAAGNVIVPGKVVFRPDSGCPVKILTGYLASEYETDENGINRCVVTGKVLSNNEIKGAVQLLWDIFGGSITETGHKQLDKVGLIYGDSITLDRQEQILSRLADAGFASGNVVLGIGSFTYQYNTRDTYGFAMKATYGVVNDKPRNIFKDPITDDGLKKSATGLLRVELENGEYVLYDKQTILQEKEGEFRTVFLDGHLVLETTLSEIRARLAA